MMAALLDIPTDHPDGTIKGESLGLDLLDAIFERVQYQDFIWRSLAEETWGDAEALAAPRPGGTGRGELADLLGIAEFGLGKRGDAFRRLFEHRDPAEMVRILPGRALAIGLRGSDGGPRWYAWETVADDHATYLFRLTSDAMRDEMLRWTQGRNVRSMDLLGDRALQVELGYRCRVMHVDQGEDPLGRWWEGICAAVGLSR